MKLLPGLLVAAALVATQPRAAATMSGIVVTADGLGVPGVEVRAEETERLARLTGRTAADGSFRFSSVAPGRWVLTATADGFLDSSYGSVGVGQPGVPVRIEAAAPVDGLRIVLARPASLAGRVLGRESEPVPSAVHAMTVDWTGAGPSLRRLATATTDRDGRYAIDGLAPRQYLVLATPFVEGPVVRAPDELEETSYGPAFYPSARAAVSAAVITLMAGEQASGLDIVLERDGVAAVEVTLTRGGRGPLGYVAAVLLTPNLGDVAMQVDTSPTTRTLQFARVAAGEYELVGSALEAAADGRLERLWARRAFTHDGRTPGHLALELEAGASLEGRVVFEGNGSGLAGLPDTWLRPVGGGRPDGVLPFAGTLATGTNGAFMISAIAPGRYLLQPGRDSASEMPDWSISHVSVQGEDLADLPIELRAGDRYQGVEVRLTDQRSELAGMLTDQTGRARFDVTLVAFPVDSRYWLPGSRRVRFVRPDTSGFYLIGGLPAGEYFLAAVSSAVPDEPAEAGWLGDLAFAAVRVRVSEGGRTTQDLRFGGVSVRDASGELPGAQVRQ